MTTDPLINIIVPIYNVEQYLRKCIDSILSQTYTNLRVIFVDDGSSDNCGQICDEYAKTDDRVTIIHRQNGGLSAARNSGLDICEGEYVAFVDGDDYVVLDYIEFLYKLLKENSADISQCGWYIEYSQNRIMDSSRKHTTFTLNSSQAIGSLCYNGIYNVGAWGKLYKLKLFKKVRFPEGRIFEDTAVSYLLAEKSEKIAVNLTPKYYYVQRYDSIANGTVWAEKKYQLIEMGDEMASYITEHYPALSKAANVKRVFVRLSTLSQMVNCNHYDKQRISEMKRVIKQYRWGVLLDKKASRRDKLGIIALTPGFWFYFVVWKLYYRIVRRRR